MCIYLYHSYNCYWALVPACPSVLYTTYLLSLQGPPGFWLLS